MNSIVLKCMTTPYLFVDQSPAVRIDWKHAYRFDTTATKVEIKFRIKYFNRFWAGSASGVFAISEDLELEVRNGWSNQHPFRIYPTAV